MKPWMLLLLLVGCASTGRGPYESADEGRRDTARAQELSQEAAELIESSPAEAERLLKDALTADIFYGPAHNNLGVLYLSQEKLFEAANEFEWARKVMPGHPDPRMNLALTLERAGRWDDAIRTYETALEVYPGHRPSEQALARLLAKADPSSEGLAELLGRIQLRGETTAWRHWAQGILSRDAREK